MKTSVPVPHGRRHSCADSHCPLACLLRGGEPSRTHAALHPATSSRSLATLRGSTPCVAARPELTDRVLESRERVGITGHSLKGGDPAAPSGTATLLRLHPPHRAHLRHLRPLRVRPATSGAPDSGGVTGGVYKAREHIHRSVLTCGY